MDLGLWLRAAAVSFVIAGCGSGTSDESPSPSEQVDRAFVRTVQSPLTTTVNYANVVLGDSPVSYWRLGERSGTTAIDMVGNVSGTYQGAPVLDSPGALVGDRDGAPSFNNPNAPDYVLVPDAPNQAITNAITLECWVTIPGTRFAPATNTSVLVKTTHNLADGYGFYWNQNNLYFYINSLNIKVGVPIAGTANTQSAETTQSRFHHLVGTYDINQGKMSIYFDGLPIASAPYSQPIVPAHGPFFIGKGYVSLGWYGKIDEVALYNHALSASAVQAHYLAGLGMPAIDSGSATSYSSVWVNQWATGSCPSSCNAVCAGCAKSCAGACSPAPASDALVVTATLLASELSSITGTSIPVVPPGQAAPPNSVQLIRSSGYNTTDPVEQRLLSDLSARDRLAFAAISDPSNANAGLKLIGRSDGALNDAAAYYLRLLGERHILPNQRWKFRPSRSSVRWNVARVESPEFAKGINWLTNGEASPTGPFSTSSFYGDWYSFVADNMLIGSEVVTGHGSPDASGIDFNTRFRLPSNCADWLGNTYVTAPNMCPAGQSYSQQPTSHPEWRAHLDASNTVFAPVTGAFGWHSVGYSQFQSLFAQDRVASMIAKTARSGNSGWPSGDPDHPQATTVSTEEVDTAVDDIASPDQLATLANAAANSISSTYPGQTRYAAYLAYSTHNGVPSVSLQPNVLVDVVPYGFNTSIYDGDDLVTAWSQTAAKKRLYDYWADPVYAFETPILRPGPFAALPQRMRFWRSNGLSALTIEGSKGGGAMGLDWYMASQMAWNTHNLESVIHTEIMDLAFGSGGSTTEQAMDRMLSRWSAWFNLNTNELTLSISDLTQALGTSDSATRARITDYVAYVHYLVMYYQWQAGIPLSPCQAVQGGGTAGTLDALIQYIWKIDSRDMIHAYPLFSRTLLPSGDANLQAKWADANNRTGIGWQTVPPLGAALDDTSLQAMLACDANLYQVTGSTMSSATTFTGAVTPVSGPVQTTWKPSTPNFSGDASFYFYAQPGSTVSTITFDLFPYATARITFQGPAGSALIPPQTCSPTGGWVPITFDTKQSNGQLQPGIYTVHVRVSSTNPQANIAVGNGIPFATVGYLVSAQNGVKPDPIANPAFPDTYFYVPPGTTQFGIVGDILSSVPLPRLYDSTGALATDALGHAMPPIAPGWTTVPVNGHYGVWHLSFFLTKGNTALSLVNVPNLFSPRPEQVLQQAVQ